MAGPCASSTATSVGGLRRVGNQLTRCQVELAVVQNPTALGLAAGGGDEPIRNGYSREGERKSILDFKHASGIGAIDCKHIRAGPIDCDVLLNEQFPRSTQGNCSRHRGSELDDIAAAGYGDRLS